MVFIYIIQLQLAINIIKDLFQVKTKALFVFVDEDLYGLDKDEIPNLPPNATYFERPKPKGDFMQYMPWTNIRIDSRKKYSLLFSSLLLNEKEDDLLDQFNKNSIIKLELDTDLALILGSLRPFFS